jgi:hypothetical protein
VFGRLDQWDGDIDVLRRADLGARLSFRADRLHRQAMREHRVMPNLVELGQR